ncbi:hypothetical protein DCCM_3048 [Desulfocucumis palustris]|uniref:Uncharacterized protein n=1 Tax=Desulfocucumis palustris TaxID=1898651 RepID=A0A2L2XC77_9FIRM|nr:hypothetical protein DCCM_3048 [Desulfocucumis palustris]
MIGIPKSCSMWGQDLLCKFLINWGLSCGNLVYRQAAVNQ